MNWFWHGSNIQGKIDNNYHELREVIKQFRDRAYSRFRNKLMELTGTDKKTFRQKVDILNDYYGVVERFVSKHGITSQSKFRPTVLEEFCGYLFKDIPEIHDLNLDFFNKHIFAGLKINSRGKMITQTKDVDFCIGKEFNITVNDSDHYNIIIPIVAVECKTYLDNTMFSESQFTARKIKNGTPSVKTYVLAERNEVALSKIPSQSPIDEVFILRKDNSHDIEANIFFEFFEEIYKSIIMLDNSEEIELPGRLLNPVNSR